MAGSYEHVTDENGSFRGTDLLENMRDMREAVEQCWFMISHLAGHDPSKIKAASDAYFACCRSKQYPPYFMASAPIQLTHRLVLGLRSAITVCGIRISAYYLADCEAQPVAFGTGRISCVVDPVTALPVTCPTCLDRGMLKEKRR